MRARTDNMEYALININSNEILEKRSFEEIPPDISHKGIRWLPINVTRPGCDLNNQVEEGPITTITNDSVEIVYTVKTLSAEELRQKRFNEINQELFGTNISIGTCLLMTFNEIRKIRNLPELTPAEFINLVLAEKLFPTETEENFIEYDKDGNPIT